MPESAASARRRKAAARAAGRRREAVSALNIAEATVRYASSQLANGCTPEQARDVALEMAGQLVTVAAILRKSTWLPVGQRRALAVQYRRFGMPTRQIADRLGVSDVTVRKYLRHRSPGR